MYEKQKVDKFLDGLKSHYYIGLKSNILTNEKLRNDFALDGEVGAPTISGAEQGLRDTTFNANGKNWKI